MCSASSGRSAAGICLNFVEHEDAAVTEMAEHVGQEPGQRHAAGIVGRDEHDREIRLIAHPPGYCLVPAVDRIEPWGVDDRRAGPRTVLASPRSIRSIAWAARSERMIARRASLILDGSSGSATKLYHAANGLVTDSSTC